MTIYKEELSTPRRSTFHRHWIGLHTACALRAIWLKVKDTLGFIHLHACDGADRAEGMKAIQTGQRRTIL